MAESFGSLLLRHKSAAGAVFFFLVYGFPLGVFSVWGSFEKNKTVPEWLAEKGWPRVTRIALIWLAVSFAVSLGFYGLLVLISRYVSNPPASTPVAADPPLTFEIDAAQVRTEGGTIARHVVAQVRLRCQKTVERPMAIRDFHAALIREGNPEQVIVAQESSVIALGGVMIGLGGQDERTSKFSGWTISQPLTPSRSFIFYLDITPEQEQALSRGHFIRITMVAVGQQPTSIDVDVNDWQHARDGISDTTIRRQPK